MDRILVVIFSQPDNVFAGRDALKDLSHEDFLTLYSYAIITKKLDGKVVVNEEDDRAALKTALGSSIGALIGLLGGPAGFAIGTTAGFLAGVTSYLDTSRVSAAFVDEVSKELTPGKFALVADINEDWTSWLDLRMTELGGVIYRYAPSDVKHTAHEEEIASMKADLAQLKAEHERAAADRKAKLYEKVNQLDTKIQQHLEKEKKQRQDDEEQAKAKADVLKAKASAMKQKAAESPQLVRG